VAEIDRLERNRLLAMVPQEEREHLAPEFELVELDLRQMPYEESQSIEGVYFPLNGVISLVSQHPVVAASPA
jgi:hypothetical protein